MKALLICFIFLASAFSQEDLIKVPAVVDPHPLIQDKDRSVLSVGDTVDIRIDLSQENLELQPVLDESIKEGPITWGDGKLLTVKEDKAPNKRVFVFQVTCYRPGGCKFPGFTFSLNEKPSLVSEDKILEFAPVEDAGKEEEVFEPESIGLPWKYILSVLGVVLFLLGIGFFIYRKIIRKTRTEKIVQVAPPVYIEPLMELENSIRVVDSQSYLSRQEFKKHYFGISDALKRFLGRVLSFNAEDRTTQELKQDLEGRISFELKSQWISLFTEMDVTKFTDFSPNLEKAQSLSSRALDLAKLTNGEKNAI